MQVCANSFYFPRQALHSAYNRKDKRLSVFLCGVASSPDLERYPTLIDTCSMAPGSD